MKRLRQHLASTLALATLIAPWTAGASSHREAPFITENPKVDGTDFYMFNSYEGTARDGYVTLISNYLPLQDSYGGPNYFNLDPDALYEIHIDNTGDGIEDLTFQFDFDTALAASGNGIALDIGGSQVAIPLHTAGSVSSPTGAGAAARNVIETYTVNLVRGLRRTGTVAPITNLAGGSAVFNKPLDNAGTKTIADYPAYAAQFVADFDMPGCTPTGVMAGTHARVFVGQRKEGFAVNLGQIFDLVNMGASALGATPTGNQANVTSNGGASLDQGKNIVGNKNVTSIAIEVPASCLVKDAASPVIAGWMTASLRQARVINPTGTFAQPAREGGPWVQVSRLGMVLVNEIVIGLKDKNKFNNSEPKDDAQFATYVTNPTLPELVEIVFGAQGVLAPTLFPRADLVAAFLNGIPNVNVMSPTLFEAVRLNTTQALVRRAANQSPLAAATCFTQPTAVAASPALVADLSTCDTGGFPNGRRPGDDTVDIALNVAMGYLLPKNVSPFRTNAPGILLTDGALTDVSQFQAGFPYLENPVPGAP